MQGVGTFNSGVNMNFFSFADPEDADGILKIMEADITPGGLQLLYTRRDDPYESFLKESSEAKIGVIRADNRVVATVAAIPRKMYINGIPRRVCYVSNMKRLKQFEGYLDWHKVFKEMCGAVDCDFYFCSLLDDNEEVKRMLHKKRRYMPYAKEICDYKTYIISPKLRIRADAYITGDIQLVRGSGDDEEDIVRFLNDTGSKRDFFPVFDRLSQLGDIGAEDFCLLKREGRILAAGALWDRSKIKQYVVKGCHGIYALLRFFNPILPYLGYIKIPADDEIAPVAFISFLLAEDDNMDYYRVLLSYMSGEAENRYSMLVIGTDGLNAKKPLLDSLRSVSFDTQLNAIIMTNIDGRIPPECNAGGLEAECAFL